MPNPHKGRESAGSHPATCDDSWPEDPGGIPSAPEATNDILSLRLLRVYENGREDEDRWWTGRRSRLAPVSKIRSELAGFARIPGIVCNCDDVRCPEASCVMARPICKVYGACPQRPFCIPKGTARPGVRGLPPLRRIRSDSSLADARTCEGVECEKGEECVMQEVECKEHPCHPAPRCIPEAFEAGGAEEESVP
ncbi:unnamed protein product [Darwinula stevensoni]|uniref:Uncharacterized protein n=1 Tax=Darwinula stevensoni TaxID=69355 RepID=A0A7R8XHM8_9CRUS|nr:unnamed protein product [Darwinula stevensoni]CAG0890569.1 unnamed protein product [Darwinula stevensoni]